MGHQLLSVATGHAVGSVSRKATAGCSPPNNEFQGALELDVNFAFDAAKMIQRIGVQIHAGGLADLAGDLPQLRYRGWEKSSMCTNMTATIVNLLCVDGDATEAADAVAQGTLGAWVLVANPADAAAARALPLEQRADALKDKAEAVYLVGPDARKMIKESTNTKRARN